MVSVVEVVVVDDPPRLPLMVMPEMTPGLVHVLVEPPTIVDELTVLVVPSLAIVVTSCLTNGSLVKEEHAS